MNMTRTVFRGLGAWWKMSDHSARAGVKRGRASEAGRHETDEAGKAAEDCRTPKAGAPPHAAVQRGASWTAAVLCRFGFRFTNKRRFQGRNASEVYRVRASL